MIPKASQNETKSLTWCVVKRKTTDSTISKKTNGPLWAELPHFICNFIQLKAQKCRCIQQKSSKQLLSLSKIRRNAFIVQLNPSFLCYYLINPFSSAVLVQGRVSQGILWSLNLQMSLKCLTGKLRADALFYLQSVLEEEIYDDTLTEGCVC